MSETQSIVVVYELPKPPETVWRALTEPALVARWLMETDIAPVVGHKFTFRAKPVPGWDGIVHCEILEATAPRTLRYSWRGGTPERRLDTTVTWTLTPTADGGTRLELVHAGFTAADRFAYEGLGNGWRGPVGTRLRELTATL